MKCVFITSDQMLVQGNLPTSSGVLLSKNERASEQPSNIKQTYEVYDHAIFVNGASSQLKGMVSLFGILLLATIPLFWWDFLGDDIDSLLSAVKRNDEFSIIFSIVIILVNFGLWVFCFTNGIRALRFDLLSPKRIPIIFNRKTKKFYVFIVETPDSYDFRPREILKTFMPWSAFVIGYDWANIEAILSEKLIATSSTSARKRYFVELYAKENPDSSKIIGRFLLTPPFVGKETCLNYWEYVRRYMEEGGEAVLPKDKLAPAIPRNVFQAAQVFLPYVWPLILFGAVFSIYFYWDKGSPLSYFGKYNLIVGFVAFVSSLSVMAIFFNWVGHRLGSGLEIPKSILDDIGNRIKSVDQAWSSV